MSVTRSPAPDMTASMNSGKSRFGRIDDRLAERARRSSAARAFRTVSPRDGLHGPAAGLGAPGTPLALICSSTPSSSRLGFLGRALERAAGLRQEDVVEGGSVELHVGDAQVRGVQGADHVGQVVDAGAEADGHAAVAALDQLAEALEHLADGGPVAGVEGDHLDGGPADLGLQGGRGVLGHDLSVVDDPHAVGQDIGLLQVLGGEEDRHALLLDQPRDLLPERGPALWVKPGRRLVEEQHARPVDQGQREVEPALHPARVAADGVGRRRR